MITSRLMPSSTLVLPFGEGVLRAAARQRAFVRPFTELDADGLRLTLAVDVEHRAVLGPGGRDGVAELSRRRDCAPVEV